MKKSVHQLNWDILELKNQLEEAKNREVAEYVERYSEILKGYFKDKDNTSEADLVRLLYNLSKAVQQIENSK